MQISEVMTRNPEIIAPDEPLSEAARLMREQDTGFLPVCDGKRILGTITDRDIVVRAIASGLDPSKTSVREAMTSGVAWCFESEDVSEAAQKMKEQQIRRLVVVNENKKLVGVLSLGDLATEVRDESIKAGTLEEISKPGQYELMGP